MRRDRCPGITTHEGQRDRVRLHSSGGFTLLELILVLSLITLILGLSSAFFLNALPSHRFNATVREISTMIRHARTLALVSGEKSIFTINLDSKQYGIDGLASKGLPPDVDIKVIDPVAGEIRSGTYQIYFPPSGGIEGGTIVLSRDKRSVSIQPDPVIGSVVINQ
jgi:general secretion pathway protein H